RESHTERWLPKRGCDSDHLGHSPLAGRLQSNYCRGIWLGDRGKRTKIDDPLGPAFLPLLPEHCNYCSSPCQNSCPDQTSNTLFHRSRVCRQDRRSKVES